jgi:hypothetical protein
MEVDDLAAEARINGWTVVCALTDARQEPDIHASVGGALRQEKGTFPREAHAAAQKPFYLNDRCGSAFSPGEHRTPATRVRRSRPSTDRYKTRLL